MSKPPLPKFLVAARQINCWPIAVLVAWLATAPQSFGENVAESPPAPQLVEGVWDCLFPFPQSHMWCIRQAKARFRSSS
jgi:hypothetical protein